MRIEHIAIWMRPLECLKDLYTHYFSAQANQKYSNPKMRIAGFIVENLICTTGDGCCESLVIDPDDNHIGITV